MEQILFTTAVHPPHSDQKVSDMYSSAMEGGNWLQLEERPFFAEKEDNSNSQENLTTKGQTLAVENSSKFF